MSGTLTPARYVRLPSRATPAHRPQEEEEEEEEPQQTHTGPAILPPEPKPGAARSSTPAAQVPPGTPTGPKPPGGANGATAGTAPGIIKT